MLVFGQRIRLLRTRKNWKQENVAKAIGVTPEMVSVYELGKSDPKLNILVAFADLFEVSTDYLLGRTNIPTMAECQATDIIDLLSLGNLTYKGQPLTEKERDTLVKVVEAALAFKLEAQPAKPKEELKEEPVVLSMAAYGDIEKMVQEKIEAVKEELRRQYQNEKEENPQDRI